jgi:ornithine cyclodeaminase/alanine dehydrogenase-like protein (mu-crystallin family)
MNSSITRRKFIQASALGALAVSTAPAVLGATGSDKKIRLGLIGAGWYGMVDVNAAFKVGGVEVVAVCDVDRDHLDKSAQEVEKLQGKRPLTFRNYEDLLKTSELDAVVIATRRIGTRCNSSLHSNVGWTSTVRNH